MLRKKSVSHSYLIASFAIAFGLPVVASAQQPTVLAELFSNINCPNCPIPDSTYEAYVAVHPGVVLINYHNSTTDNQDPFYTGSFPASNDRDNFYVPGGQNDPSASIDGFVAGSVESQWESFTNDALQNNLPGSIAASISRGPSGSGIDTISFTVVGSSSTQVVAYVAIKESHIYYANTLAYLNPPDSLWNDVFRAMLPNGNGGTPFSFSGTHNFSVVYDPSNYTYNGNQQNMTAVIFVQDKNASSGNNHQVEALGEISLASPSAVAESSTQSNLLIIPENPLPPQGHLAIELASPRNVQLTLSDLLGREVRTLVDGRMPSGQTSVELEGSGLAAGCYVAHLSVDGRDAGHAMLVIE